MVLCLRLIGTQVDPRVAVIAIVALVRSGVLPSCSASCAAPLSVVRNCNRSTARMIVALLACLTATAVRAGTPEDATISSYVIWNDTSGNPVHAHGAGMWVDTKQSPPLYYMVGTSIKNSPGGSALSEYITLYKGTDL